jgi:hypothetical protein
MNELQLLKEAYAEQMWERRANGIETESFEDWDLKRKARLSFFENWKNASSDAESIAEARVS